MEKRPEQTFLQRRCANDQQVFEKVSSSYSSENYKAKPQVDVTSSVRMAIIRKTKDNKVFLRTWRTGDPCAGLVGV